MNGDLKKYLKNVLNKAVLVVCSWVVLSCGVLHDDLSNCDYYLRFSYDYNMTNENLFPKQVEQVEVFVFDANGEFLKTISEKEDVLKDPNYKITLPRSMKGYQIVVWAGKTDAFYTLPTMKEGDSIEKLTLRYDPTGEKSAVKLDDIWHSGPSKLIFAEGNKDTQTVSLVRNTNYFDIKLKDGDKNIPITDYKIEFISRNGSYDHKNIFLTDNKQITYSQYELLDNNLLAKFASLRLIDGEDIIFTITDNNGNKIKIGSSTEVNLISLLLLNKPASMTNQEYLDREYLWNLAFNVSTGNYLALSITINGWTHWLSGVDL